MHKSTGISTPPEEINEHERLRVLMTKEQQPESKEAKQLKQQLEEVSTALMNIVNARDYGNPLLPKYMSPDFTQEMLNGFDASLTASNLQEFVTGVIDHVVEEPSFSFDVISSCAEVDMEKGKATVWLTSRLNGYFTAELQRDGVSKMDWRRSFGKWLLVKHTAMTGAGAFVGAI